MKQVLIFALCATAAAAFWTEDPNLKNATLQQKPVAVPRFTFDLDLPAENRWTKIAAQYKTQIPAVLAYLHGYLPKWAIPVVETIGANIDPYFPKEYADEMRGAAKDLGIKLGDVVMMNLVYQLEHIGINCTSWNNTGPTIPNDPGCMDIDPKQEWCYCHKHKETGLLKPEIKLEDGPGLCTSIVAEDKEGHIYHGRNLDWNLDVELRKLVIDIEYQKGGKTVYTGTSFVGFSGILNGIRPGVLSASIDARGKGGKVLFNLLQALKDKSLTPTQNLRQSLEVGSTFAAAVEHLGTTALINEIYYIAGGTKSGEGVVISRDREGAADTWYLNQTKSFYLLETNYDHWLPVPKADDRRTPAHQHMDTLSETKVGMPGMLSVMTAWPTFNHHTDYTGIFAAFNGTYESNIWI